jgi:hypothetical protein
VAQLLSSSIFLQMKCWVQIVDSHGAIYKDSNATRVTVDDDAIVDDLRDAVKVKNSNDLAHIDARNLTVYKNKADLDNKQPITRLSTPVKDLGKDEDNAVFVVVPNDTRQQGILSSFLTT